MSGGVKARPGWETLEGLGYLDRESGRLDLFRQVSATGKWYEAEPGPALRSVRRSIRADCWLAMTSRGLPGLTVYGWGYRGHRSNPQTCDLVVLRLGAAEVVEPA